MFCPQYGLCIECVMYHTSYDWSKQNLDHISLLACLVWSSNFWHCPTGILSSSGKTDSIGCCCYSYPPLYFFFFPAEVQNLLPPTFCFRCFPSCFTWMTLLEQYCISLLFRSSWLSLEWIDIWSVSLPKCNLTLCFFSVPMYNKSILKVCHFVPNGCSGFFQFSQP